MTKLEKKFEEYYEAFGDSFPTAVFGNCEDDEIVDIIDDCIKHGKDVYDAGYADLNNIY